MFVIDFWNTSWFERYAPLGAGLVAFAACYFLRFEITGKFSPNGWDSGDLYSAVFDWSSVQSGFVFAIYGFIISKRDGFAGLLVGGQTYERFLSFTRRACLGGFALSMVSLPLLVVSPSVSINEPWTYWPIATWFAFFIWAFCAFLRVAFSFGMIVATPDRPDRVPG